MKFDRRAILAGLGTAAFAGSVKAQVPAPKGNALAAAVPIEARVVARALENVLPMTFDGHSFAGPGWEMLVREGSGSEFFLFGEEHGTHEAPILAARLFEGLRPAGYDTLVIEISPPIAQDLDHAARGGLDGVRRFIQKYPPGPAFYFWQSEAELIVAARAAVPGRRDVLWGIDYEVTGDRRMIEQLKAKAPPGARASLAKLDLASQQGWSTWRATHNPGALFMFSGDPALVKTVRAAWPRPDADVAMILDTIEETLEINRLFPGKGWESNERRARFARANFVRHLKQAEAQGLHPKAMIKMGENHLQRGVNWTGNFDTGSLAAEVATLRGGKAFSVLVGGGRGGHHGILNPTNMSVADAPVDMLGQLGLSFITDAMTHQGPAVVDLRPLRPLLASAKRLHELNNSEAVRNIFGYDALVVWNGSTATSNLVAS